MSARTFLLGFCGLLMGSLLMAHLLTLAGRSPLKITGVDPVSYFAVTRSILFDGDFDLTNEYSRLSILKNEWNAIVPATQKPGSPFPIGVSMVQIPAMILAAGVELLVDGRATGYSEYAVVAWFVWQIVVLAVGMLALHSLLSEVGAELLNLRTSQVSWPAAWVVLVTWFGTTLGYYSFSPMGHTVAFSATCLMLWTWRRASSGNSIVRWCEFGAAAGLMCLCRWQDALMLTIPIVIELRRLASLSLNARALRDWSVRLVALPMAAAIFFPQMIQWKEVYGAWLTIPQGSGFLVFPPIYIAQALFSSQHGWFVWTPLALLGCFGLLLALPRAPTLIGALLFALVLQVALVGMVSTWHGHLFGLRYLTSLAPILSIGLLYAVLRLDAAMRIVYSMLMAFCAAFTLLFAVQYRLDLIPDNDRLTIEELLVEKLQFGKAKARVAMLRESRQAFSEGRLELAWQLTVSAKNRYGDSLELIRLAEEIADKSSDEPAHREMVKRRAEEFNRRLLF